MKPITTLKPNEIFVFGSNLAGVHGAGAALTARKLFGAKTGQGTGKMGQCYAIPTKNEFLKPLSLLEINWFVATFLRVAEYDKSKTFLVTPIGCGLAGYRPEQIAPMFRYAPDNVILPPEFAGIYRIH